MFLVFSPFYMHRYRKPSAPGCLNLPCQGYFLPLLRYIHKYRKFPSRGVQTSLIKEVSPPFICISIERSCSPGRLLSPLYMHKYGKPPSPGRFLPPFYMHKYGKPPSPGRFLPPFYMHKYGKPPSHGSLNTRTSTFCI